MCEGRCKRVGINPWGRVRTIEEMMAAVPESRASPSGMGVIPFGLGVAWTWREVPDGSEMGVALVSDFGLGRGRNRLRSYRVGRRKGDRRQCESARRRGARTYGRRATERRRVRARRWRAKSRRLDQ